MTPDSATDLLRHALLLCMLIAGPVLLVGLIVGLVMSLLQAVTQIQEQSLSVIPRLVVMLGAAIVLMPWMCQKLMDYTQAMFTGGSP